MGGRDVEERGRLAAVGLVAPRVGHRTDLLEAERRRDMAGDGIGVDEEDPLVLAQLEGSREIGCDRRLADAALRIEYGNDGRAARPVAEVDPGGLEDRPAAVVDGLGADAHGLDAPAQRFGRVRPGEVLVVDGGLRHVRRQAIHGTRRNNHQSR